MKRTSTTDDSSPLPRSLRVSSGAPAQESTPAGGELFADTLRSALLDSRNR
jgi:hypothetical protein